MLSQAAVESLSSVSYIEDYLDCVENLPDDVQRHISYMRELDVEYQEILGDLETHQERFTKDLDSVSRKRVLVHMQRHLIRSQEIGDEKLQIVQQILDLIENKARQLDLDYKNMGVKSVGKDQENAEPGKPEVQPERSSKRARRQRNDIISGQDVPLERVEEKPASTKKTKKKKRKSKVEKELDYSPNEQPIDPDEPTYCLCQQISYGEMIGCDNERCSIEWFHFSCVGLTTKPKGKWFCPKCRGDRPNVMKPRS